MVDVCLEELAKVNATKVGLPLTEATFLDVPKPFFVVARMCGNKLVQARVVEKILEKFLLKYSVMSDNAIDNKNDDDKKGSLIVDQGHVRMVSDFIFRLGSDTITHD